MKWRLECKHSGSGRTITGTLSAAIESARAECTTDFARWVLWSLPGNLRIAEVTLRGPIWVKSSLTGQELRKLMRGCRMTIGALAFRLGISQQRIQAVRERGLFDSHAVRDWMEAITGEDPGPLPQRYRIRHLSEEAECCDCGCPLYVGEAAYEYAGAAFCSVRCARKSRGWS